MLSPLGWGPCSAILLSVSLVACTFVFDQASGTDAGVDVPTISGDFYISPKGDDDNDGKTPGSAVQTWRKAFSLLSPKKVLVALPGVYSDQPNDDGNVTGLPIIDCVSDAGCDGGCPPGAIGNPIEVRASKPREAILRPSNIWPGETLRIKDCIAWTVGGFVVEGALASPDGAEDDVIRVSGGSNITLSGLVVHRDNVALGGQLLSVGGSTSLTVEDTGFYDFRNKAIVLVESLSARFRRIHVSGAGSSGGGDEDDCLDNGDIGVQVSASPDAIFDNIVVEGACLGIKIQPLSGSPSGGAKIYNSLVSSTGTGIQCQLNCEACADQACCNDKGACRDLLVRNTAIQGGRIGIDLEAPVAAMVENVTVYNTSSAAIRVYDKDPEAAAELVPGEQEATISKSLIFVGEVGVEMNFSDDTTTVVDSNVFVTDESYLPVSFQPMTSYNEDPQSEGCVAQPSTSWTMRNILQDTRAFVGANIIFRSDKGIESQQGLWDHNGFPCGALVEEVNDTGLTSCSDVHVRFGVGLDQCPLPEAPE